MVDFAAISKRLFAVRSFKGQSPGVIRERFRLVTGLVRDVVDGRLSQQTAMRLSREIATRLHEGGPLAPGPKLKPATVKRLEGVLLAAFGSKSVKVRASLGNAPIPRVFKDGGPTGSHRAGHHTLTQPGVRRLRRGSGV